MLATRTYQDAALANSLDALLLFAGASSYCVGFPELVVPIVMQLKLFARSTQVARFRRQVVSTPSLRPSFPPSLRPSVPPSLRPSVPPSLPPSFPPSLLPSFPPSLPPRTPNPEPRGRNPKR